jgi:hypothetical protein
VPGVALYAYMTAPVVGLWGEEWLAHGAMTGKFIRPVYDGEVVRVDAEYVDGDTESLTLQLFNAAGDLSAVGEAARHHDQPTASAADFPVHPLPDEKLPAMIAALPEGTVLGSIERTFEGRDTQGEFERFLDEIRADQPIYEKAERLHPAYLPAKGNRILMENVDLGPWIHTATRAWHHGLPRKGEVLSLRGGVAKAYAKRGHELVDLNLAVFGADDTCYATLIHTAIVKPKVVAA